MLTKNNLSQVIIAIDHTPVPDVRPLALKLQQYFSPEKTQRIVKTLFIPQELKNFKQEESTDYILTTYDDNIQVTLSTYPPRIAIGINQYINRETYKSVITNIQNVYQELTNTTQVYSRRIGIRFINHFDINNKRSIGKIFQKKFAGVIRDITQEDNLSRTIALQEYNLDWCKSRVQYGFYNKWYPEVLKYLSLLLDIDVYSEANYSVNEWLNALNNLSNQANEHFKHYMNTRYLDSLK